MHPSFFAQLTAISHASYQRDPGVVSRTRPRLASRSWLQLCKTWTPLPSSPLQGRLSAAQDVLEAPSLAGLNPLNPGTRRERSPRLKTSVSMHARRRQLHGRRRQRCTCKRTAGGFQLPLRRRRTTRERCQASAASGFDATLSSDSHTAASATRAPCAAAVRKGHSSLTVNGRQRA